MKKIFTLSLFAFASAGVFGQSFSEACTNNDSTVYGSPGSGLTIYFDLINNTASNNCIDAVRITKLMPSCWTSAFCLDVCFPDFVDSARVCIAPNSTQACSYHFYTCSIPCDSGKVRMRFHSITNNDWRYQWFIGNTCPQGVNEIYGNSSIGLYPSVAAAGTPLTLSIDPMYYKNRENFLLEVFDVNGRLIARQAAKPGMLFFELNSGAGLYFYKVSLDGSPVKTGKLAIR